MKYAVIKLAGCQYFVSKGQSIKTNKISDKEGNNIEIKDILLLVDEDKVFIGKPLVEKAKVTLKIVRHFQGDKIRVAKFKAKTGYRRITGFRPKMSELIVEKITP